MTLRKKWTLHVLRHPGANFGHGEWHRVSQHDTKAEAISELKSRVDTHPDEHFRVYHYSMISHDSRRDS